MLSDWIELCELLNAHGVEFLVVGGQAVAAHGYPRLTKDLDLWVRPTAENGRRVLDALREFAAAPAGFEPSRFEDPRTMLVIGRDPFRIDILTEIPGVTFDDAWPARATVVVEGKALPFIGRDHLIANKRAAGRLQDLADAEELEKVARGRPADEPE